MVNEISNISIISYNSNYDDLISDIFSNYNMISDNSNTQNYNGNNSNSFKQVKFNIEI